METDRTSSFVEHEIQTHEDRVDHPPSGLQEGHGSPLSSPEIEFIESAREEEKRPKISAANLALSMAGDGNTVDVYPTGMNMAFTTVALLLAALLAGLDRTIVATAIPKITSEFNSLDDIGWYGSAYLLTNCSFQLLFGKIYGLLSVKWTFVTSIIIFEIGSIICGTAPNSTALIIGRAVAGLGCGGINSGAFLIISLTVPLRKRAIYTSLIGAMVGISGVVAPIIGGIFTDRLTWRWCFHINYPIGGVSLAIIITFLQISQDSNIVASTLMKVLEKFDLLGTFCFVPANICLLLALQWGGNTYAWSSWRIILLFCLSGILFMIWVSIQLKKQDLATLPPRIISQRSMAFGVWASFTIGAATFTLTYFIPIWFQAIKGTSAMQSGVDYLPMPISATIFSIIAGVATTKIGYYVPIMITSSICLSVGTGLLTTLEVDTGHSVWIGYQIIAGAGVGLGFQQAMLAAQTVLLPADISTGLAVVIFAQTIGGAIFVSVGQTAFGNKLTSSLHTHVPDLDSAVVIAHGATGLREAVGSINPDFIPGVLVAYNEAITTVFVVGVVVACLNMLGSLGMEWKSVKEKKDEVKTATEE